PLFARLRLLDLSQNIAIGDTATRLLAQANPANNLEVLNLAGNNITLNGLDELFQSTSLTHLNNLNASGASPALSGQVGLLTDLTDLKLVSQLRSLDLSDIQLPLLLPARLRSFCAGNLRALYLRNIRAGKQAAEVLASAPSLANLIMLDLQHN